MNILVTGKSGTGKTTLCSKLVDSLKKDNITCGGVLCPGNYAIDLITNEKRLFLDKEGIKPHKYSKVFINEKGLDFAIKANVKRFGLFHLNQERSDEEVDAMLQECKDIVASRNIKMECFAIGTGFEITL